MRRRRLVAICLTPFVLAACEEGVEPPAALTPEAATARLNEWLDARFEESLDFSPMTKTDLGRKEDNDRLDPVSEGELDEQHEWLRGTVADLRESFDRESLTSEGQTSYDLWIEGYEQAEAALPWRRHWYLFNQMRGAHSSLPQFLINTHLVADEDDITGYISRLRDTGRYLGGLVERARLASAEGIRAPRFAYEIVLREARAVIAGAPFDDSTGEPSPLWADANAKIDALLHDETIGPVRASELRAEVESMLRDHVAPAYEGLIAWLEDDIAETDEVARGVWALPDGDAFYAHALRAQTTTDMTADEIHALGLAEVERIHGEMEAIVETVGFDGTLDEFFEFVRTDPQFFLPNTDEGRETYLETAREHLATMQQRLPDYFGLLPEGPLDVRRVEAFRERDGGAAHYRLGSPDGSRPGIYYVHLSDMAAAPLTDIENIAYHEGVPGHHMQLAIAQELDNLPLFRTRPAYTAYIEGWGLYAEWLAKEMGAYENPYTDFGRLQGELWRAIRLVVDTGLHSLRWTQQDAVDYAAANSAVSRGEIESEVRRYLVLPGQATTYKIGMLKIQELRERAEAALGDEFDIRDYHDIVLGGGAMPLNILERRVDDWIAKEM